MATKKKSSKKKSGRKRNYGPDGEGAYDKRPDVKKKRAARNRARYAMIKAGRAAVGDGKDVNHKKELHEGGTNDLSNLKSVSRSKNRSFARTKTARRKKSKK